MNKSIKILKDFYLDIKSLLIKLLMRLIDENN